LKVTPVSAGQSARTGIEGGRVRVIDGFRAVSIATVVLAHASATGGFPAALAGLLLPGSSGVAVFFVISGYLITALLLAEEARTGGVSLRNFYVRRVFRILPALLVYVAFVAAYDACRGFQISRVVYANALTFTTGVFAFPPDGWLLQHTWSLAVEEQFYLVWPLAFVWFSMRRRFVVAAVILVVDPVIRAAACLMHRLTLFHSSLGWADAIMWGCFAALTAHAHPVVAKRIVSYRPTVVRLVALAVFVTVGKLMWAGRLGSIVLPFGATLDGVTIAYLIVSYVEGPPDLAARLLARPAVVRLGVLSYSLYLWQQFFTVHEQHLHIVDLPLWKSFPWNVAASLFFAGLSYSLVEAPMLRMRRRYLSSSAPR
jgi:peptidoglycan/LPS O-acetylase OafA/YrhL